MSLHTANALKEDINMLHFEQLTEGQQLPLTRNNQLQKFNL